MKRAVKPCMTAWWARFCASMVLPTPLGPRRTILTWSRMNCDIGLPKHTHHHARVHAHLPADRPDRPALGVMQPQDLRLDFGLYDQLQPTGPKDDNDSTD